MVRNGLIFPPILDQLRSERSAGTYLKFQYRLGLGLTFGSLFPIFPISPFLSISRRVRGSAFPMIYARISDETLCPCSTCSCLERPTSAYLSVADLHPHYTPGAPFRNPFPTLESLRSSPILNSYASCQGYRPTICFPFLSQ